MYVTEQFEGVRDIHMGIDIGAPSGTQVFSVLDGTLFDLKNHNLAGDYGPTLIARYEFEGIEFWALYGHLSQHSLKGKLPGQRLARGELIATVGEKAENGGWNPHLHFQLSLVEPVNCDMRGAVSSKDLEESLRIYPDPQLLLGKLYND